MFESLTGVVFLIIFILILVRILKDSFPNAYVTYLTWTFGLVVVGLIIVIFQQQTQQAFAAVWSIISFPLRPLGLSIVLLIGTLTSIGKDKKISDGGIKQLRIALIILVVCSIPLLANLCQQLVITQGNYVDKIVIVSRGFSGDDYKDLNLINKDNNYGIYNQVNREMRSPGEFILAYLDKSDKFDYTKNIYPISKQDHIYVVEKYISNRDNIFLPKLSENQIIFMVSCEDDSNYCFLGNSPSWMLAQTRTKYPKISVTSFMPTAQALSVTTQVIEAIGLNISKSISNLFSR